MLERGEYDRHLRRARLRYRRRRDALLDALDRYLPSARASGIEAGLHVLVELTPGTDPAALVAIALELGVGITSVDRFRSGPPTGEPAIVLGYSNLPEQAAGPAVQLLADAIARLRRAGTRQGP